MDTTAKPIIFLAFANDRGGEIGYLRNLPEEARQVHAILDAAAQDGLCEVVLRQNVTVEALLDVFQDGRYRNRIALFHYGGHAESYELLLETAAGKTAVADAGGLAAFLSSQRGLQLVFLNGCSTQPQVQGLLDAGVAAVIATAQAIDDKAATDFAVRFYKGLAGGAAIATAFHEAEAACRTAHGGRPRGVYVKQVTSSTARRAVADRWPWSLTPRPGAELVLQWNLPEAVNDPLFGLPALPPGDLPESPFRNILWFRREDAPIFFGRGYDIRELYQRITAPDAAPIVLYYGQSGVGKSSLLAAGLLPRLEQVQTAVYTRRDQLLGLAGTLAASLPAVHHPPIAADSGLAAGADLLARWRAVEGETGKPLTVLLDQVEEVYTRPNAARPGEMAAFLDLLGALFGDPATRPQGRLVLSFRKEWLAEIEKLLAERQLPRTKVFLQRLEKRGIVEAVTGPARNERLQRHFGLTVEPELAGEIADDLLSDPSSAVAPTLQILLSKMWRQAKGRDYDRPLFNGALYQELRRQGLLLSDFLEQQLATLRGAQPAAVDSGLALDLLAFHTTPLGTAEQRTLAELRTTYAHQAMALPDLLAACRDLYLLVDPAENRPDAEQSSRLAHDTLAPLVRHRFEESDAPGQRARRILETRSLDWRGGKQGAPLDDVDLALVESGRNGMHDWHEDEKAIVSVSHARQKLALEERQKIAQERERALRREVEQAEEITRQTKARLRQKTWIVRVLSTIVGIVVLVGGLNLFKTAYFYLSPWKPVAGNNFPDESVAYAITFAPLEDESTGYLYCVATWMVGVGCSRNGNTWNFFQEGLPTGSSAPTSIGGFSGNMRGITALAFDEDDPKILHAASTDGNFYRSSDSGQSWKAGLSMLPAGTEVKRLAAKGKRVIALTGAHDPSGDRHLYISTDSGQNWHPEPVRENALVSQLFDAAIDTQDGSVIAVTSTGIWRAQNWDKELTWRQEGALADSRIIEPMPGPNRDWIVVSFDAPTQRTVLWLGQLPAMNAVATWVGEQPMSLAPSPRWGESDAGAMALAYVLLVTGDVVRIDATGEISRFPGILQLYGKSYDIALVPRPNTNELWLLLAHQKGVMKYMPEPLSTSFLEPETN